MSAIAPLLAAHATRAEEQVARVAALERMSTAQLACLLADAADAAPWLEAAAAAGIAEAQVRLGRMLLAGEGVPENPVAARRWFLHAARSGDAEAQNMAGRCHELGWGCAIDLGQAARWYARAADQGLDWGEYNYANLLFDGRGVAQDRALAVAYYSRAARRGHARAMNLLGRCLEEGWGVARDPVAAADWYRRSAEAGYFRGQFNHAVGLLGRGRRDDALGWLNKCAAAGDPAMQARVTALIDELTPAPIR